MELIDLSSITDGFAMKKLYDKIKECGEIFATPGNTMGMGDPGVIDIETGEMTEPVLPIMKPYKEKPVKHNKRKPKR